MSAVGFYHLTRDTAATALPSLLDRSLRSAARAVVRCADAAVLEAIDLALWQAPSLFLPHGSSADAPTAACAERQPIWLTTGDDVPNGAQYLFRIAGSGSEHTGMFERVFDLFDGNDPISVAAARLRWTAHKAAGDEVSYYRQEAGGWRRG